MQVLGINWFVLQTTGSAAHMGLTVLLQTLPVLVLSPWGGALADRLPGRPVLIATQLTHGTLALALAGIAYASSSSLAAVYAISLCGGLVSALEGPVMGRFNATVVDRATLGNALSLGSLINSTGRILGMSVGGMVIAAVGPAPLFAANAISFLGVVVALLAIRPNRLHALDSAAPETASPETASPETASPETASPEAASLEDASIEAAARDSAGLVIAPTKPAPGGVRAGLAYLIQQPQVLVTLALAVVLGSLGRNYQITMAAMTAGPLGAGGGGYGVLSAAFAVGTVLGGLTAARRLSLGYRTLIGAGLIGSALQFVSGLAPSLWTFAAVIVPIAAAAVMIDTTVATRIQLDTHGAMRGRVLAAAGMASAAAGAVGAPLLGWLAEQAGPRQTLVLCAIGAGIGCVVAGMALARHRGIRMDRHELHRVVRETLGRPAATTHAHPTRRPRRRPFQPGRVLASAHSRYECRRGTIANMVENLHPATQLFHQTSLRQRARRVVSALDVDVRTHGYDKVPRCQRLEHHHIVHTGQGREHRRTIGDHVKGPTTTLEAAHGLVGVQSHNQHVAKSPRLLEVGHVPHVQHIKATVGQDEPTTLRSAVGDVTGQHTRVPDGHADDRTQGEALQNACWPRPDEPGVASSGTPTAIGRLGN
jgi:MFS family permease